MMRGRLTQTVRKFSSHGGHHAPAHHQAETAMITNDVRLVLVHICKEIMQLMSLKIVELFLGITCICT